MRFLSISLILAMLAGPAYGNHSGFRGECFDCGVITPDEVSYFEPFHRDGRDWSGLDEYLEHHIQLIASDNEDRYVMGDDIYSLQAELNVKEAILAGINAHNNLNSAMGVEFPDRSMLWVPIVAKPLVIYAALKGSKIFGQLVIGRESAKVSLAMNNQQGKQLRKIESKISRDEREVTKLVNQKSDLISKRVALVGKHGASSPKAMVHNTKIDDLGTRIDALNQSVSDQRIAANTVRSQLGLSQGQLDRFYKRTASRPRNWVNNLVRAPLVIGGLTLAVSFVGDMAVLFLPEASRAFVSSLERDVDQLRELLYGDYQDFNDFGSFNEW